MNSNCVWAIVRVSNTSWHVGGEWAALPPPVALWGPQGFTDSLAASAPLDPGCGDAAAGCRPPPGSVSGGTNDLLKSINIMLTKCPKLISNGYIHRYGVYGHTSNTSPMKSRKRKGTESHPPPPTHLYL